MFEHPLSDAFFDYGVGAMCWSIEGGRRVLWFLAPPVGSKNPKVQFDLIRIYTERAEKHWSSSGPIKGWDGNLERPTLHGSVWLRDRKGWHGFIVNGDMRDA